MSRILTCIATIALLGACSNDQEPAVAEASSAPSTQTLAASLSSAPGYAILGRALEDTGLSAVFDGNASYTLIAPSDDAFGKLGDAGKVLQEPEQRAALASILRGHVIPGYMAPDDIDRAIAAAGGKPVKMPTMGRGPVTFSRSGEDLVITDESGATSRVNGRAVLAGNGVAIPVDTVLVDSAAGDAQSATR